MTHPGALLLDMLRSFAGAKELAWRIAVRDISALYRQTLLGYFWSFMPPLLTALVFVVLQKNNVVNFGTTDTPYALFAVTGTMLWQSFVESLTAPLKVVMNSKKILSQINFPRESLILAAIYEAVFGLAVRLAVLFLLMPFLGAEFSISMVLFIIPALMLVAIGIVIGILLTPLGVLYGDIYSAIPVVAQLLFFVTPVVYPPPQTFPYSALAYINPGSPFLLTARSALLGTEVSNWTHMAVVGVCSLVVGLIALVLYRVAMPIVIERISS
jgi:lipopolysaccharide transport system permease protein